MYLCRLTGDLHSFDAVSFVSPASSENLPAYPLYIACANKFMDLRLMGRPVADRNRHTGANEFPDTNMVLCTFYLACLSFSQSREIKRLIPIALINSNYRLISDLLQRTMIDAFDYPYRYIYIYLQYILFYAYMLFYRTHRVDIFVLSHIAFLGMFMVTYVLEI